MSINENAQHVGYQVDSRLNTAIQEIYHYSHSYSHSQFKHYVLNALRKLINCDSAHWATVDGDSEPKICSLYSDFHKQASSTVKSANTENFAATDLLTADIEQLLTSRLNIKPESSVTPLAIICYDDSQTQKCPSNIANIQQPSNSSDHRLVSIKKSAETQLYDIFILQRNENRKMFSSKEHILNQHIIPHILEAYRINLLHNRLINNFSTRTAVCDLKGNLLLVDESFSTTLSQLQTKTKINKITDLVFKSLLEKNVHVYEQRKIIMKAKIIDDLMFISFLEERRRGGLSGEERLVTKYMIQGQNHIDMARQLKIPTSSILYMVNCIYKKLGIKNKAELNMKFSACQENITIA